MSKPLFPNVPEDVSQLSDEDLSRALSEIEEGAERVAADEVDGKSRAEIRDELKQAAEDAERIRAEQTQRAEAAEAEAAQIEELLTRTRGQSNDEAAAELTDDTDAEADDDADADAADDAGEEDDDAEASDEDDAEEDAKKAEAIAASAKRSARPKGSTGDRLVKAAQENNAKLRTRTRPEHRPTVEAAAPLAITASADIPGFPMGSKLESANIAEAMAARFENLGTASMENEKVPVVKMRYADAYPDERRLIGLDDQGVMQRIQKVVGDAPRGRTPIEALTASGGLCAPVEIRYDLEVLAQADRPVRDSLPNFNAARGGIRFATPPSLASITTAVGRITAAADLAGGGGATKGCQVIACPPFVEVDVAAIYHCLQFGNMGARAFPELVANATELTMAAWARVAETALLDGMVAASTHATVNLEPNTTSPLGANAILLPGLLRAAAAMRNRQRMDPEAALDVWMPAWTLDLLTSDVIRSAFDRFSQNDAELIRTMESFGLRVNFYWDGPTSAAQVFGAQTNNGTLLEFPPTVEIIMAPPGSFLLLDAGTLDLGLVRDSTLNRTNDYQMFGESWENLAFVGLESLRITANVCDTGAVAAAVTSVCGS